MKYFLEKVITKPDESITVEEVVGPVARCVYHHHPEYELTFVQESFGCRYIGNNVSNFVAGDLVLIRSNVPHYYYTDPKDSQGENWSRLLVIQFQESHILDNFVEFNKIATLLKNNVHGIVFSGINEQDILEVKNSEKLYRLLAFWKLLGKLSESKYQIIKNDSSQLPSVKVDERLNLAIKLIHDSLERNQEITLKKVSKATNMTPISFSRYFHKSTDKRFIDYLIELKLARAKNLLLHTSLQIWDIAEKSNFKNLSNFNRLFQKHYNISPREYRQKWQL